MAVQPRYYAVWSWTWSAVIAGVFASLLVQILLTMLGLGIGIVAVDISTTSNEPAQAGWWTFVWWAMSGIIAAFVGGMVAGGLSPDDDDWARAGHALAAWAVTTVIVVAASTLAAGSAANVVTNLAGPSHGAIAQLNKFERSQVTTTGSVGGIPSRAEVEKAQKHFGYVMLASLAALLLGAGAAYGGGLSSRQETLRIGA
jgi:hypothetical protein